MLLTRIATAAFVLALAGSARAQDKEAELCTCVTELNAAISGLHQLDPNATGEQVERATMRAEKAAEKLEGSLEKHRPKHYAVFDKARAKLEAAIAAIPDGISEAEARASIEDEETAVRSALEQMLGSVQCQ
jgi:outer membrane murein-binding lipoprotein Lpp